jgi:hypothetical protein
MDSPAIRQNPGLKLEKVTLTSRRKLAESRSVAYQRSGPSEQIGRAVEAKGKMEFCW